MCPLLQGVESLLLVGGDRWEDGGERIIYAGDDGQTAEQTETLRPALRNNASTRRAIRVVRAHVASAADLDEDESLLLGAGRGGLLYRYDGLYLVQRAQAGIEDDDEFWKLASQLACGIADIHKNGVIHLAIEVRASQRTPVLR